MKSNTLECAYWLDKGSGPITWREAIAWLYRVRVVLGRAGEKYGVGERSGRLRQIPPGSADTTESMAKALKRCDRSTCSYKELFNLLRHLAKLVAVPLPEVPLPTDTPSHLVAVPSDAKLRKAPRPGSAPWCRCSASGSSGLDGGIGGCGHGYSTAPITPMLFQVWT